MSDASRSEAHGRRAERLARRGDWAGAGVHAQTAARLAPADPRPRHLLACALYYAGDEVSAEAEARRGLALGPTGQSLADLLCVLAAALRAQGRATAALDAYRRAAAVAPTAEVLSGIGHLRLESGDWGGWKDLRTQFARDDVRHLVGAGVPRWDGEPTGSLLVHASLEGYGDSIQGLRFARAARGRCGRVWVLCRPPIAHLLARIPGIDGVVQHADGEITLAGVSAVCSPMELIAHLAPTPDLWLGDTPYIGEVSPWRPPVAGLRVGLQWRGSPGHAEDLRRSPGPAAIRPLASVPGVTWVRLQHNPPAGEIESTGLSLTERPDHDAGDWLTTAETVAGLDLVISPDTAVAHLAGALGVPVWIALPWWPEWRWPRTGDTTPWYASARLWRQPAAGEWAPVFAAMAAELATRGGKLCRRRQTRRDDAPTPAGAAFGARWAPR